MRRGCAINHLFSTVESAQQVPRGLTSLGVGPASVLVEFVRGERANAIDDLADPDHGAGTTAY